MSTLASVFGYGLFSARPAASVAGRFYYATDTSLMYRDNGSSWDTLAVGAGSMATDTLWDAAGDLAVGTGANTGAKLALTAPAANILNVLGVANGETTPTWKAIHDATAPSTQAFGDAASAGTSLISSHRDHKHAMPADPRTFMGCRAYNSATQSINNNTDTLLTFDSEVHDTSAIHSTVSNTSRHTVPSGGDGYWRFHGRLLIPNTNSTGGRYLTLKKNGTAILGSQDVSAGQNNSAYFFLKVDLTVAAVATDYFELNFFQNSGGTINVGAAGSSTDAAVFECYRVGV